MTHGITPVYISVGFLIVNVVILSVILPDIQAPGQVRTLVDLIPTVALAKVIRLAVAAEAPWTEVGPALALVMGCAILLLVVVAWLVRRSDR